MQYLSLRLRYGLLIVLVTLLLAGVALAAGETIPRSVVSSGGGALSSANIQLRAAVGQPSAGTVSSTTTLCSGLLCGAGAPDTPDPDPQPGSPSDWLYLPLVVR
jgi:hypothetical protein